MGLKEKIKKEFGYMGKGAKVLPSVVGRKVSGYVRGQYEAAKEQSLLEKQAREEAKAAAGQAYKEEYVKQEKEKAIKKARAKASGQGGVFGILREIGEAGDRMSVSDMLGMGSEGQAAKPMGSVGEYIMPRSSRTQGNQGAKEIDTGGYILSGLSPRREQGRRHNKRRHHGRR
jgi:hypothetical protein